MDLVKAWGRDFLVRGRGGGQFLVVRFALGGVGDI